MKTLYVIGSTIAIGSTWFFAVYALLTQGIGIEPTSQIYLLLLISCVVAGGLVGWKIFVSPAR